MGTFRAVRLPELFRQVRVWRDLARDGVELPKRRARSPVRALPLARVAAHLECNMLAVQCLSFALMAMVPSGSEGVFGRAVPAPVLAPERAPARAVASRPRIDQSSVRRAPVQVVPRELRRHVTLLEIDQTALEAFAAAGGGVLRAFPLDPLSEVDLVLQPNAALASVPSVDQIVLGAHGELASIPTPPRGAFLSGKVAGDEHSVAFFAASAAGTFGFVQQGDTTWIISSGPYGGGLPTVAYNATDLPDGWIDPPQWMCETAEAPSDLPAEGGVAGAEPCRQFRVAFETDHEYMQKFGGNANAASGYIATVAGALTTIFERDLNARLATSYVRLWNTPSDPWSQSTLTGQLNEFRSVWVNTMGGVQRDIVHFLSGRNLGGGVADLPGLCSGASFGYGLSTGINGSFPTPLVDNSDQNWDIYLIAHEVGHNFGGVHTHSIVPPVDGCGSIPADCSNASQGTLMSYCGFCAGGIANIALEFHPQNVTNMAAYIAGRPCNYTGPARPPVAVSDAATAYPGVAKVVDVLANDFPFNCESVVIESFTAVTGAGATITRTSGGGPNVWDVLVYSLPAASEFIGLDAFSYTLRDASGQTASGVAVVTVSPLREPDNPVGSLAQLSVSYYELSGATGLPFFTALTPYATGTVPALDFGPSSGSFATSGRSDEVGAVFVGWIDVPASGGWTFSLSSDEGSRLTMGSTVVVSHDGLHPFTEKSGTIGLAAGRHAFKVEYFEATGSAGLVASWQGPGVAKAVIPASALTHGGGTNPADFNSSGTVDAIDLGLLLADWGLPTSPYDLTGDDRVTAPDLSVLLFNWTG
jgi:hypothetical protein